MKCVSRVDVVPCEGVKGEAIPGVPNRTVKCVSRVDVVSCEGKMGVTIPGVFQSYSEMC